ncbi:MAG: hypothetical protein WEK74_07885, partial [Hydrogenophaga sp.]
MLKTTLLDAMPLAAAEQEPLTGQVTPLVSAPALMRQANQTLAEQLAERFAGRIRDRLLAPGARL